MGGRLTGLLMMMMMVVMAAASDYDPAETYVRHVETAGQLEEALSETPIAAVLVLTGTSSDAKVIANWNAAGYAFSDVLPFFVADASVGADGAGTGVFVHRLGVSRAYEGDKSAHSIIAFVSEIMRHGSLDEITRRGQASSWARKHAGTAQVVACVPSFSSPLARTLEAAAPLMVSDLAAAVVRDPALAGQLDPSGALSPAACARGEVVVLRRGDAAAAMPRARRASAQDIMDWAMAHRRMRVQDMSAGNIARLWDEAADTVLVVWYHGSHCPLDSPVTRAAVKSVREGMARARGDPGHALLIDTETFGGLLPLTGGLPDGASVVQRPYVGWFADHLQRSTWFDGPERSLKRWVAAGPPRHDDTDHSHDALHEEL